MEREGVLTHARKVAIQAGDTKSLRSLLNLRFSIFMLYIYHSQASFLSFSVLSLWLDPHTYTDELNSTNIYKLYQRDQTHT